MFKKAGVYIFEKKNKTGQIANKLLFCNDSDFHDFHCTHWVQWKSWKWGVSVISEKFKKLYIRCNLLRLLWRHAFHCTRLLAKGTDDGCRLSLWLFDDFRWTCVLEACLPRTRVQWKAYASGGRLIKSFFIFGSLFVWKTPSVERINELRFNLISTLHSFYLVLF